MPKTDMTKTYFRKKSRLRGNVETNHGKTTVSKGPSTDAQKYALC